MKTIIKTTTSFWNISKTLNSSFLKLFFSFLYWKLVGKKNIKFNFVFNNTKFNFFSDNRVDLAALDEIFVQKEYQFDYRPHPTSPYQGEEQVQKILDLGANVGDTAIFYSILFPNAKIFAVEPNPHVHEKLGMNTLQFPNIKVCKCAISNFTGKINLNFGDSHLGSSINNREQNKNSVEVDVYNLQDFCKKEGIEEIYILKFDIEGAEEYLLQDADFIKNNVVQIVGEMHDDLVTTPLTPLIESLNLKNVEKKILNKKRYILYGVL